MSLKVLIVPDKFKGTLSAQAAADAIARGWRRARPGDRLCMLPMSDGGDGFGQVLGKLSGAQKRTARTVDAAHRHCSAPWWWIPRRQMAIVESACAIGLAMLPPRKFHPFELDTFGLGKLLQTPARRGARRCIVGIGGSATNDGGFGMARALGWQFLDSRGKPIERWIELEKLVSMSAPAERRLFREVIVAVDVRNPLLGPRGASRIYGPQKGLRPEDFARAEACLGRLAQVVRQEFGRDFARLPGAGAAGGLGFGLSAFLGARFRSGFDLFARDSELERRIAGADLVLTGEGAVDVQTLMGKGVGQVAKLCRRARVPCIALAGTLSPEARKSRVFTSAYGLTDLTSVEEAKTSAALWLERLAAQAAPSVRLPSAKQRF